MSKNTDKGTTTYQWDKYVKEAQRPDFVLEVDDKTTIRVANPTGVQIMRVAQGLRAGDMDLTLMGVAGDSYKAIMDLLGGAGFQALSPLLEDMLDHFDLYEDVELVGPSGGKVTERRPTKIQQLLKVGYRPVGEA